jgi:dihydroorotase
MSKFMMFGMPLREGSFEFVDNYKGTRSGQQRLFPITTVLAGKPITSRA